MKIDLKDVTFCIPLKIDSEDRKRNLKLTISFLVRYFDTNIIICESDKESNREFVESISSNIKYMFDEDTSGIFKRTRILNDMTKLATTSIAANYDVDCVFMLNDILMAVESIRQNIYDVAYPYNGSFKDVPYTQFIHIENGNLQNINLAKCYEINSLSCGGCFFYNVEKYYEIGLENENMISWGCEDHERLYRMNILGLRIGRSFGRCYHMSHSRDMNGKTSEHTANNDIELKKIESMNKGQLQEYIKTFKWIK